jgi:hypothetical protein
MDFSNIISFLPETSGVLSIIGYGLICFWFVVAVVILIISIVKAVLAIWNIVEWGSVGNSLLLFLLLIISAFALYGFFHNFLDEPIEGTLLAQIMGITNFVLFIFANLTIVFIILAKYEKAEWSTVFKMIATIAVFYIPIVFIRCNT